MQRAAKELLEKYKAGLCNEEEEALIESWYLLLPDEELNLSEEELEESLNRIEGNLPLIHPNRNTKGIWYTAICSVIFVVTLLAFIYLQFIRPPVSDPHFSKANKVKEGNKAILTLAGGRQIILNNNSVGKLATQGNAIISNTVGGQIHYKNVEAPANGDMQINNITTPKGVHYQLILSEGTKVWLNAASSITYPVAFTGNIREVSITGEVYFEVAKNKAKPFLVRSATQTVQVLGTHFNINTYLDNGPVIETTLLEGSVEISNKGNKVIIKPGEQARVSADLNKNDIDVVSADTEEVLAWRKGDLLFENQNIRAIMNKVSRQYDIDVEYDDKLPEEKFNGEISHASNVAEVMKMLQQTCGVHFRTEGRRVFVTP